MFFRTEKKEIKAGDAILDTDFTEVKNDDGTVEVVTVGELKKAKQAQKAAEIANAKKNEKMVDDDEEVEVDGEKVNMGDLKKCYQNMKKAKHNEDDAEEEKKTKEKEEKENAEKEAEKDKKEKEEKENANRLAEITNAHLKKAGPVIVETQMDKLKRGQNRYTFNKAK